MDKAFRQRVEAYLKRLLSREIKLPVERIDAHEPFVNYGIDSVVIVNLNRELERRFGELSKTLFFEYPNLHKLAGYLVEHLGERLWHKLGGNGAEPVAQSFAGDPFSDNTAKQERHNRFVPSALAPKETDDTGIAVIGLAGRYPQAHNLTEFWENLRNGRDCIEEIPSTRWNYHDYFDPDHDRNQSHRSYSKWGGFIDDMDKFDPLFFHIAPRDAEQIDPQERLFLQTVWQTVEDAGYTRDRFGNDRVGLFVGVMYGEYQLFSVARADAPILSSSYASIANRASYFFNFTGPSIALDTMCSSSLTALHLACESIRRGECEYAIAGGVNLLLHPQKYLQLSRGGFLSTDGRCRAFGEGGNGYVPGEGVGAVLLKPMVRAVADGDPIHGVIRATAVNHGGRTNGYTVPNPNAQAEVVAEVLQRAGIEAQSISYIEAHGTGTALGDPIEIEGLSKAFGDLPRQSCAIGAVKSNIGHLESAAGIAALTKVLLQMRHRTLVPSLHAERENTHINFKQTPFRVQREVTEWMPCERPDVQGELRTYPRRAGINSFGAGGSNAHVIVEEYTGPEREVECEGDQLVVLSARSPERLKAYALELLHWLQRMLESDSAKSPSLAEIAYTLQIGREAMEERLALVVSDLRALQQKLAAFCADDPGDGAIAHGNIHESDVDATLLEGEEAATFMRTLMQACNMQKIARLWLAGARIEWDRLWRTQAPACVSLPTYPFTGDRYWAPHVTESVPVLSATPSARFDRIDYQASLEQGIVFEKHLHLDDPSTRDHRVNGQFVFPGVGQLLLALAAAEATGIEGAILRRVAWRQPLVVGEKGTLVQVRLFRTEGELRFAIRGRSADQWLSYSEGEIASAESDHDPGRLPIAELQQRMASQIESDSLYKWLSDLGLQYGSHYQVIGDLWYARDMALSRVTASSLIAWLDGGLQTIAGLGMAQAGVSAAGIPFSVEEVTIGTAPFVSGYAHVLPLEGNRFDVVLADETQRIIAELRGVYMRPLPATTDIPMTPVKEESEVACSSLIGSLVASTETGPSSEEPAATYPLMEYFFHCLVLDAFRRLGVFEKPGERHETGALQNRMGVLPSYTRLFDYLLDILQKEGWVRREGGFVTASEAAFDPKIDHTVAGARQQKDALAQAHPEMKTYIDLLWACLQAYPEVLTGQRNAMDVLFPERSTALVEGIYSGNEQIDCYNRRVADLVAQYVSIKVMEGANLPVRILEIGAGTGGTSAFVLSALRSYSDSVEYLYTDISASFTHDAQARFGKDYPFATFATLDIERDPVVQGFQAGSMDLVIATNVLHATRRIDDALSNLRLLLKNGGLVFLNELTRVEDFATLSFGLTDGWWRFEDETLRLKGGPLLSVERWMERLSLTGFRQAQAIPVIRSSMQSLLAAEAKPVEPARTVGGLPQGVTQTTKKVTGHLMDTEEINVIENSSQTRSERMQRRETDDTTLQVRALEYLQDLFARLLKAKSKDIRPELTFDKLGIDSLLVTDITNELSQDFGKLPMTLLFENPTVNALASYFVTHKHQALKKIVGEDCEIASIAVGATMKAPEEPAPEEPATSGQATTVTAKPARIAVHTAPMAADVTDVAIIGLSGRYPGAENLEEFWENLCQGRDSISEIPADRWDWREYYDPQSKGATDSSYTKWGGFLKDADKFDPMFFSMSPLQADAIDPQERLFLETAWALFEDAGITRKKLDMLDHNVGVFVGIMNNHYARHGGNTAYWSVANRVSYFFDLNGPSMAIDSACSSSLTALHLACESIRRGECQAAIAGGVNVIAHPAHYLLLSSIGMVSPGATCRPFAEDGDGFVDGEGVGAVLLKPLEQAVADGDRIYAVVKGSFVNASGRTSGYQVPNPNAQARVIGQALQRSGIDPRTIGYIEAHGTGTALGDPIEISGLSKAFQAFTDDRQFCAIGSVKSNIGHLESAAGISGLTKVLLQLRHKRLVPSLHARKLNPHIMFEETPFYVQQELSEWKPIEIEQDGELVRYPLRAGISSFGAGGSNVHLLIEEYATPRSQLPAQREHLIVLSARNDDRLKAYAQAMLDYLDLCEVSSLNLAEIAYTLQTGREAMEERLALIASSPKVLREKLTAFLSGNEDESLFHGRADSGQQKVELLTAGHAGSEFLRLIAQDRDLRRLAQLWIWGAEVDWKLIYPEGFVAHISLPTYPFARERCWVSKPAASHPTIPSTSVLDEKVPAREPQTESKVPDARVGDETDLMKDLLYVPCWKIQPLPGEALNPKVNRLLMIHAGNVEALVSGLREAHHEVFEIILGERNVSRGRGCWEVACDDEDPYEAILRQIGTIDTVYHLGGIGSATPSEHEQLRAGQELGLVALFRLVKALTRAGYAKKPLLLKVLTANACRVSDADIPTPYGADLHGFMQSLAKEFLDWQVVSIDLGAVKDADVLPGILQEPGNPMGAVIAFRGNNRYVRSLLPASIPSENETPFRPGGVYLIIGGGRGIGLAFAKYLAIEAQARLVLVGRSELDSVLKKELEQIEAAGSDVLYLRADATDPGQMRKVVAGAKARYGRIDGAVHSALVLNDCSLQNMTELTLREALAPKVDVCLSMVAALEGEKLDFILFFSSAQSFFANPGQSNYAAGCTFKDAFAEALRARGEAPVVRVINWGYWGDVGAVAGEKYANHMASFGIGSIKTDEGMESIRRILLSKVPQLLVFKGTRELLRKIGVEFSQEDRRAIASDLEDPLTSLKKAATTDEGEVAQETAEVDLLSRLKSVLADILRLSPDKIDENKLFSDYGIDSIMTMILVKKLENTLDCKIEPVALVNHPTITALSEHLAELTNSNGSQDLGSSSRPVRNPDSEKLADPDSQSGLTGLRVGPSYVQRIKASLERDGDLYSKIKSLEQTLDRPASSFWSLNILAYFQSKGLLNSAETIGKESLSRSLGVSPGSEYLFEALLWSLKRNGLIAVTTEGVSLTDTGASSDTKRSIKGLSARRELLMRTTPEVASNAQLFERCIECMDDIFAGRVDPAEFLFSAKNRPLLEDIYRGEHRLAAVINAALAKGLESLGETLREDGRTNIRVLEIGPATLCATSSLLDTLHEYGFDIDHYFTTTTGVFDELKVALAANQSQPVNVYPLTLENVLQVSEEQKFDIVRLQMPLLSSDYLAQCIQLAAKAMREEGVILLSDLAVADLMAFTLGLVDPGWAFGVSSATTERSPQEALDNALRLLKKAGLEASQVLGRWLITGSPSERSSATFTLKLPAKLVSQPPVPIKVALTKHTLLTSSKRLVEYFTCGQGEPVIFLTAIAFESSIWRLQIEALANRYRLILPHLPGHGGSIYNGKSFTFDDLADDLIEVMDQQSIEAAHLVGWCMAGNISQLLAVRHPRRLLSLSLVCTTPTDARARGLDSDDLSVYSENPLMFYELEFQNIYGEYFYDNPVVEGCLSHVYQCHAPVKSDAVLYYMSNLFDFDTQGLLNKISVPTLVISGKWDIAFPPDQVRSLHAGIPGSDYYEFGRSGHMPFLTEPDAFNHILDEFLTKVIQRGHSERHDYMSESSTAHLNNRDVLLKEEI
ncbi:MAG: alpha/beta fold hydrolase [Candidatus Thiodiazotropha sp.]